MALIAQYLHILCNRLSNSPISFLDDNKVNMTVAPKISWYVRGGIARRWPTSLAFVSRGTPIEI